MNKYISQCLGLFLIVFVFIGCFNNDAKIIETIKVSTYNNNELKIQLDVLSGKETEVFATYWPDSIGEKGKMNSLISKKGLQHKLVLCNIIPQTNYSYQIISAANGVKTTSKIYTFQSRALPVWLQEQFKYSCNNPEQLPQQFKDGLMLMNKRESPGILYMVDYKAQLRWYHMIDGTGFKVTRFTQDTSIISILGKNDEPTSYGSEILEVNLLGDTLLHLKKGQGDFKQVIHHEVFKRSKNEIITLYVDDRVMDLSSIGGGSRDTVSSDGILIMDNNGKKLWQWSVFDVMDPLKEPGILKNKKDWTHANSLNFDKDGNFLISFYNLGQIWKLDSHTGKIIWKFGKGGTIAMPAECNFTQSHAVHINPYGSLMFFDNGVEKKQSEVFALKLDEANKSAKIDLHIKLPLDIFNERMGSAYMVTDSAVLCCCSKKHITVLANKKGTLLWTLNTGIPPYRVEFLKKELFASYLQPSFEITKPNKLP